jgi:hypothetical protein
MIPAGVEVTKRNAGHQNKAKWIARTKTNNPLKVGNRRIRSTVPNPQSASRYIRLRIIRIWADSSVNHFDANLTIHARVEKSKAKTAKSGRVISVQLLDAVGETREFRIVADNVSRPVVGLSPHEANSGAAVRDRKSWLKSYRIPEMLKGSVVVLWSRRAVEVREPTIKFR